MGVPGLIGVRVRVGVGVFGLIGVRVGVGVGMAVAIGVPGTADVAFGRTQQADAAEVTRR